MLPSYTGYLTTMHSGQLVDLVLRLKLVVYVPGKPVIKPKQMKKQQLIDLVLLFMKDPQIYRQNKSKKQVMYKNHVHRLLTASNWKEQTTTSNKSTSSRKRKSNDSSHNI
jgi:hypothetical protein